jgi:hypothetical protein
VYCCSEAGGAAFSDFSASRQTIFDKADTLIFQKFLSLPEFSPITLVVSKAKCRLEDEAH